MKKLFHIIILTLLNMLLINCQNFINPKEINNEDSYVNPYNQYGKLHNECVDYVLNIVNNQENMSKTINKKYILIENSSENFALNKEIKIDIKQSQIIPSHNELLMKSTNFVNLYDTLVNTINLNNNELEIIKNIEIIFNNYSNIEELKNDINQQNILIENNFTDPDAKKIVLFTTAIMVNSCEYWENYIDGLSKSNGGKKGRNAAILDCLAAIGAGTLAIINPEPISKYKLLEVGVVTAVASVGGYLTS